MTEFNHPPYTSSSFDCDRQGDRAFEDALRSLSPVEFNRDDLIYRAGYQDGVSERVARRSFGRSWSQSLALAASLLLGVTMGTVGMRFSDRTSRVSSVVQSQRDAETKMSVSPDSDLVVAEQIGFDDADIEVQPRGAEELFAVEPTGTASVLGTRSNSSFVDSKIAPIGFPVGAGDSRSAWPPGQSVMTLREALQKEIDSRS